MTDESPTAATAGQRGTQHRDNADLPAGIAPRALALLRRHPRIFVPFVVVGLFLAGLDQIRQWDPIPTLEAGAGRSALSIEYVGYPRGIGHTAVSLESLIGLEPLSLGWGLLSYGLPVLAIAVASGLAMAWALEVTPRLETLGSVIGFVVIVDLSQRVLGQIPALQEMGLVVGVPVLVTYTYVLVRLFAVPGCLVAGARPAAAVREGWRRTRGHGWTIVSLILVVGLLSWLLASIPHVGPFIGTALVAPLHAALIVAVLETTSDPAKPRPQ
ncbi:hypothetical protein [Natronolimnobius baerhuensis]|uniref:Uncharacterized protein n=1 Tax=Natronolimnobius baerhuensis TaxID=253108 RepID=A0A202EAR7_9EURY|nr:hypothetical protein [Natronolimnobius baerhuensis]OVE85334.1 hypothetical protein B2G88_00450 [Natronolimnobius baerhuensis]